MGGYIIIPTITEKNKNDSTLVDNVARAINAGKMILYHNTTGELLAMNVKSLSATEIVVHAITGTNTIITVTLGTENSVTTN